MCAESRRIKEKNESQNLYQGSGFFFIVYYCKKVVLRAINLQYFLYFLFPFHFFALIICITVQNWILSPMYRYWCNQL